MVMKYAKDLKWIKKIFMYMLCLAAMTTAVGQNPSGYTAAFLNLTTSARVAALGSSYISVDDDDISVSLATPSLINERMHNAMSISYVSLVSGGGYGSLIYGREVEKLGSFVFGLQYVNYGTFEGYDEDENSNGTFTADDYMCSIGWGRKLADNISMGASFKPILSHYESYTSFAVAFDLALSYNSSDDLFSSTLIARNIGAQLFTFDGTSEPLPFELSAGLSYKLPKAPFRLYFTATELQVWNLRYTDPLNPAETMDPLTGKVTAENKFVGILDNLARHAVVGVEFCPTKAFNIRFGYNYRRAREMQASQSFNFSGFSYGVGIRLKKLYVSYSRNNYHQGQSPNYITVTTDLNTFLQ